MNFDEHPRSQSAESQQPDRPARPARKPYVAPTLVEWGKLAEITNGATGALIDSPFAGSRNGE
jgi:hypothetical protein